MESFLKFDFKPLFIKKLTLGFFLFSVSGYLTAQSNSNGHNGKISGRIIESISHKPVEYVSITIGLQEKGGIISGIFSDNQGFFELKNLEYNIYSINVECLGYETQRIENIRIDHNNPNIHLGDVIFSSKPTTLQEVNVISKKEIIEHGIDKIVYNADKDITSQGGVATDVLKKVPEVSVDINGNIELQGNSNLQFLINGKPSGILENNAADVLQSIPASEIQSIEVITSPGAKFDAQGGGIINIILKKNKTQGVNGSFSLTGGTRLENGTFNLSIRKGNLGLSAFISENSQLSSKTKIQTDRLTFDTLTLLSTEIHQNGNSLFYRNAYQAGLSFDWSISKKNNINFSMNYNFLHNNLDGSAILVKSLKNASGTSISGISENIITNNNYQLNDCDLSLYYKKSFTKENQKLEILFVSSILKNQNDYFQQQNLVSENSILSGSKADNPGNDLIHHITLDYSYPLSKNFLIETGAKASFGRINSSSDAFLFNTTLNTFEFNEPISEVLHYDRNIYAYYISAGFKPNNFFEIKAGCREEYTESKAEFSNSGKLNLMPYYNFVPSSIIAYNINKNNTVKLSYSYRISRPRYRDLNPFVNAYDPNNITMGNPSLTPELTDLIELGYNFNNDKGFNINLSLSYKGNRHDAQPYSTFYPSYVIGDSTYTNITIKKPENLKLEANYGFNLYISIPIINKFNISSNFFGIQRDIMTYHPDGDVHGFMYRINMNATWQVTKTLTVELFGNFNSRKLETQGKLPALVVYNFALRKQLFNKKASIALNATNPFLKYINQKTELAGYNFSIYNNIQIPYRSIGLNFSYRFGSNEAKKHKEMEDVNLTNPIMPGE